MKMLKEITKFSQQTTKKFYKKNEKE